MITLIQYLTKPNLPKEYDGRIYKHLFNCAVIESIVYICMTIVILS